MGTHQTKISGIQAFFRMGETNVTAVPVSWRLHLPSGSPSLRSRAAPRARLHLCVQLWGSVWWAASSHVPGDRSALMPGSVGCWLSTFRYMGCIDLNVAMRARGEQLEG